MRVLAALSGGVDSAVAAARAVEAGHDVTAVHMALSSSPQSCRMGARGCCSLEDSVDAARAAETLGIPYYVWDLAEEFEETVINDFVEQYQLGRTPNPCVRCNEFVKFRELAERAKALGFDAVCTGHYARVEEGPNGKQLLRARDLLKDQSYVLAVMGEEELDRVILPLGDVTSKTAVREEAEARGLGVSNKPDSYDICFIPDGDTQGFLRARLGENTGNIVDPDGNVLGTHRGYFEYTVGQRKGLGIDRPAEDGKPRYVLETRPSTNEVVVGSATLLSIDTVRANELTWLATDDQGEVLTEISQEMGTDDDQCLYAQMRAHGRAIPVVGLEKTTETVKIRLGEMVRGIAAGQSLVIYRGNRVLAHAVIEFARREGEWK
ncbi:tRNA (5-methylaminomethyl-2-thiouridylate)-methyltransferase [Gleimia coleocanis DSM 15436]|uniref:tRNA-specific 2-thiouridylase MnmA n=1 Tax=Gleimia coleocanis DSM 15436 TaxID=525245 RepID=C0W040_9ACTO|nr:tRNA 2-thiouridine(34) synthase MnmA [Gleimia coleocanis]EEH63899.1 tRNA (5-methylaminomethyl-2-thiouridylate)-methyltransferase [Gleimia coleocanis DSM 15436]